MTETVSPEAKEAAFPLTTPEAVRAWKRTTREALLAEAKAQVAIERRGWEAAAQREAEAVAAQRQAHLDKQLAEIVLLREAMAADALGARKRQAALDHGLPESMAERLVGESVDELNADAAGFAATVSAHVGVPVAADTEAGARGLFEANGMRPGTLSNRMRSD